MYTIRVGGRDDLMKYLAKGGIMTKVYFSPVHLTKFYRDVLGYRDRLRITEKMSREVLALPMYPTLTRDEINYISEKIDTFIKGDNNGK